MKTLLSGRAIYLNGGATAGQARASAKAACSFVTGETGFESARVARIPGSNENSRFSFPYGTRYSFWEFIGRSHAIKNWFLKQNRFWGTHSTLSIHLKRSQETGVRKQNKNLEWIEYRIHSCRIGHFGSPIRMPQNILTPGF